MRSYPLAIIVPGILVAAMSGNVGAEEVWAVVGGTATFEARGEVLERHEIALRRQGRVGRAQSDGESIELPLLRNPNLLVLIDEAGQVVPLFDDVDLADGLVFETISGDYTFIDLAIAAGDASDDPTASRLDPDYPSLHLRGIKVGFDRLAVNGEKTLDQYKSQLREIAPGSREENWLPALRVYGEGIYLELRKDVMKRWIESSDVQSRADLLANKLANNQFIRRESVSPTFLLLHTLSHLLMNRLVFDCGYSSAALRERISPCNSGTAPPDTVSVVGSNLTAKSPSPRA